MAKHLYLYGDVASFQTPDSAMFGVISSKSVIAELERLGEFEADEKLVVHINSPGGEVNEGFAIYNILRSLGVQIETVADGTVASIATVLFLAGDERVIYPTSDFMIHNPWTGGMGNADQLEQLADELREIENKLLDFYVDKTGASRDQLAELMKAETHLTPDQTVELKFATKLTEPVKAFAKFKEPIKDKKMSKINIIRNLAKAFGLENVKNAMFKLEDGTEIEIATGDDGVIAPGQECKTGGEPTADGEYKLEDGKTIKVSEGKIAEVAEAKKKDDEEMASLTEKINALEAKNAELESQIADAKAKADAAEAKAKESDEALTEAVAYMKDLKVTFKAEGRVNRQFARQQGNDEPVKEKAEIREGMKKYSKRVR